jgi:hypothetical protein
VKRHVLAGRMEVEMTILKPFTAYNSDTYLQLSYILSELFVRISFLYFRTSTPKWYFEKPFFSLLKMKYVPKETGTIKIFISSVWLRMTTWSYKPESDRSSFANLIIESAQRNPFDQPRLTTHGNTELVRSAAGWKKARHVVQEIKASRGVFFLPFSGHICIHATGEAFGGILLH